MTNRELQMILTMRDQATVVWNKFESGVRGGVQRMGSYFAQNWASISLGAVGAFYIIMQAFDKVERLAKKLTRALGPEVGGSVRNAALQMQELSDMLGTIKEIANQTLIRVGLFALGAGKSVAVFFSSMVFLLTKSFAWIEEGLNALGLSNSKFFQNLNANAGKLAMQMSKEAMDAFSAMFASSKDLGLGFEGMRDKVERLKKELDGMDPTTTEYINKYREWKKAADELADAEEHARLMAMQGGKLKGDAAKLEVTDLQKLLGLAKEYTAQLMFMTKHGPGLNQAMPMVNDFVDNYKKVVLQVPEAFDEGWQTALAEVDRAGQAAANDFYKFFSGQTQGVKGLMKDLVGTIADQFKQLMAELAAQAIMSGILSLITGVPFSGFAGRNGGLLGLIFPGGGPVPMPVGGDTVASTRGGSNESATNSKSTIIFNNYAPMTSQEAVLQTLGDVVRGTGQTIDKIIVNNRAKVSLNAI